jgi:hypothetical protein
MPVRTQALLDAEQVQHFRDHGWYRWRQQVFPPACLVSCQLEALRLPALTAEQ